MTTRSQAQGAKVVALIALILQIVFLVLIIVDEFESGFNQSVGYFSATIHYPGLYFLVAVILMIVFIAINYILIYQPLEKNRYKGTDFLAIVLGVVEIVITVVVPALLIPGVLLIIVGILLLI